MTILFREDWDKHPNAIVDWDTSNKTARILAAKYYRFYKVKNYDFILALHNPLLKGVDVRDPEIVKDPVMQGMIGIEIKQNFWYFLREVVRVPGKGGGDSVPFNFHRANIAAYWAMLNHITTWLLGPRQITGKSLTVDIAHIWIMLFAGKNSTINLLTKDDGLRNTNLNRLRDIRKELPKWMQMNDPKDKANTEEFTVTKLDNRYLGHVPANNKVTALKKGRGITSEFTHFDEPPFQNWIGAAIPVVLASGNMARQIAQQNNAPYWTIYTTTAGSLSDRDGAACYDLLSQASPWTESFFDVEPDKLEEVISKNNRSGKPRINATFYYYMLGYTKAQILRMIEDTDATDPVEIAKDFYIQWYRGGGESAIDKEILEVMHDTVIEGKVRQTQGYNVIWYKKRGKYIDRSVILVLDPSEAVGQDALGLLLVDPYTGETVAKIACYNTNISSFTLWLFEEFVLGLHKSVLLIESRMGRAIIDILTNLMIENDINPFERMFNFIVSGEDHVWANNKEKILTNRWDLSNLVSQHKKHFGFATSGTGITSRKNLYGRVLREACATRKHVVYDSELVQQLSGLNERNGRIDHSDGEHDDLCIPWVLSHWFLTSAKNIGFYGIDKLRVLTEVPFYAESIDSGSSPEDKEGARKEYILRATRHKTQQAILEKLHRLLTKYAKIDNPIYKQSLKVKIELLKSKVVSAKNEAITLSYLEEQLKEGAFTKQ